MERDIKRWLMAIALVTSAISVQAQTWRWYPGDMDIWMGNKINNLRTQNGSLLAPFWKAGTFCQTIQFQHNVDLQEDETFQIAAEGQYGLRIDNQYIFGMPGQMTLKKGKHHIEITICNLASPPALWVDGKTIKSDSTWMVSDLAKSYPSDTWYDMDGTPMFDSADKRPSAYHLPVTQVEPIHQGMEGKDLFAEWELEGMGYLKLNGVSGNGLVNIYYGESPDEARSDTPYLCDKVTFTSDSILDMATMTRSRRDGQDYQLFSSRAMRYARIECSGGVSVKGVSMMSEMKDLGEYRGGFECSDTLINHIWKVGAYTLHLTDREVMIEGIKRDRWMWSGDAIQSYLMNYYSFMDAPVIRRTIWSMRGKDPVEQHINTIMDYTFYWFNAVYDYYLYTGDADFIQRIYPRMKSLMDFVEGRLNKRGMVEGLTGDWVFVDWSPRDMSKNGELAFEQMAFCRSLQAMSLCAGIVGNQADKDKYSQMENKLKAELTPAFWDTDRHLFVHNVVNGRQSQEVTRYANIFAVLYDFSNADQNPDILNNVLLNDSIMEITTPYMRFYELEALCKLGEQQRVMKEMRAYWGGMLSQGATTFWETYDPKEGYPDRLHMYGIPYGKSLCHAWGASPIYLLGKYYLGVKPLKPGYSEWEAEPCLGDLKWMKGDVPTPHGKIHIEMDAKHLSVTADSLGSGTVYYTSHGKRQAVTAEAGKTVSVKLEKGKALAKKNVK